MRNDLQDRRATAARSRNSPVRSPLLVFSIIFHVFQVDKSWFSRVGSTLRPNTERSFTPQCFSVIYADH